MPRSTVELREIVDAVQIRSFRDFSVEGEAIEALPAADGTDTLAARLATVLYRRKYCRPASGASGSKADSRATRVFVAELSEANCGSGNWEPGWVVKAVEEDGTLAVHKLRDDLTLWASPEQYRASEGDAVVGNVGRLRLDKELREMLPGYYMMLGDADQGRDDIGSSAPIVRFYWHLTAAAAPIWVRELTRRFNGAGVAFHAKALCDPNSYLRADAGVLYISREDLSKAMDLLPGLYDAVMPGLRRTTPMFTRQLAGGLAVAEDPGDGRSFGQHRCQLVAEGIVRAFSATKTASDEIRAEIATRFAEEGLTVARPWLSAGSRTAYAWPVRRPRPERANLQ
jgi:HopA1 effector protein family